MIITKTPFRISFFGGGTDFPDWYRQHGGNVLSTSIDKYCYITCRHLPPFFEHKHRIVYSHIENIKDTSEIKHPAVKGIFDYLDIQDGLEIHHDGDLPARSGLGSSSSFTAGLYLAVKSLSGEMIDKYHLAKEVIHIEQNVIHDVVGSQDQIATVYGGLNRIDFMTNDDFSVSPIIIPEERKKELNDHLMLFFTGVTRFSSDITGSQIKNINKRESELKTMQEMVPEAINILSNPNISILEFGKLLHESWRYKKQLSEKISNSTIDEIYQVARDLGAEGGKVLGAGGGGFVLIFAKPEIQPKILERLSHLICVPFNFEDNGASIAYYKSE
ncbi:GHMP family kinase ATP-binding protein [Vibrio spartinae]|uniref:Bifunctional fucokinase/L-fucose-1-P-guanylyltransferase n=1 Tax=Vibrio spartinae TaxID=1918945 RepID=A0A1N6M2P0_9VIBR|nr:kinase [Vibrio spartinae]QMV12995.1 bifunctional fucokinase/L-fucose-1-P-guanylyltransferase [Vibrio spartinae]SIO93699.1 D-glycero-alpha-D-manno-heptose 7-phosphate kinase [Vibrio spartinae]